MITTITSKGQITIPKGIREMAGLQTGDILKFSIEEGNTLKIKKVQEESEIGMNLLRSMLQQNRRILISGKSGVGKSVLMKHLAGSSLYHHVWLTEPYGEYEELKSDKRTTLIENYDKLNEQRHLPCDLWVIDDSENWTGQFDDQKLKGLEFPMVATTQYPLESLQKELRNFPYTPEVFVSMEYYQISQIHLVTKNGEQIQTTLVYKK